jgi:hypothetical protein
MSNRNETATLAIGPSTVSVPPAVALVRIAPEIKKGKTQMDCAIEATTGAAERVRIFGLGGYQLTKPLSGSGVARQSTPVAFASGFGIDSNN